LIVLSPTAPNSSYEEIDLSVFVEYSGPHIINSTVPLRFRYAGNPDINAINPKKIRNTFVYVMRVVYDCNSFLNAFKYIVTVVEKLIFKRPRL